MAVLPDAHHRFAPIRRPSSWRSLRRRSDGSSWRRACSSRTSAPSPQRSSAIQHLRRESGRPVATASSPRSLSHALRVVRTPRDHRAVRAAAFNSDFYVMAATVIPVFLIALLIEGTFAPALVARAITLDLASMEEFRRAEELARNTPPPPPRWTFNIRTPFGKWPVQVGGAPPGSQKNASNLWLFPAFGLALVVAGEIFAVFAVSERHATSFEHTVVLVDLIGLPVALAAGAFASAFVEARKARQRASEPDSQPPASKNSSESV